MQDAWSKRMLMRVLTKIAFGLFDKFWPGKIGAKRLLLPAKFQKKHVGVGTAYNWRNEWISTGRKVQTQHLSIWVQWPKTGIFPFRLFLCAVRWFHLWSFSSHTYNHYYYLLALGYAANYVFQAIRTWGWPKKGKRSEVGYSLQRVRSIRETNARVLKL